MYRFASQSVKGKIVLDVGCGEGYGTFYLSRYCQKIIGIDISKHTIGYAKNDYRNVNLEFLIADATNLDY